MEQEITIYGLSDDLVEVEGEIGDEWGGGDDPSFVVLSTGDRFSVTYGDRGVWVVEHVEISGECKVSIERAPEGEDPDPYTDKVTVTGPFTWVDCWRTWPPEDEQVRERLEGRLDDLVGDPLMAAYKATRGR